MEGRWVRLVPALIALWWAGTLPAQNRSDSAVGPAPHHVFPWRRNAVLFAHAAIAIPLYQHMVSSWGRSNGQFHIKDDWTGDGLMQNDEISHFMWGYVLTKDLSAVWRWTGLTPGGARALGAAETALLLTLVEFPMDAFNPIEGMGISDLIFDYAGVGVGLLAASHPRRRWDVKFSVKLDPIGRQRTWFMRSPADMDNYVFWLTYRPTVPGGDRQPFSVGLGHSVRRGTTGPHGTPVRELYLALGTTIPDLVRVFAPGVARFLQPVDAYFANIGLRKTIR